MPKIFLPITFFKENSISITGEKARYLVSVLRCKKGDELVVFDGIGNCFKSEIIKVNRKEVIAEVIEKFLCDTESPLNIILIQGILKGQKMDMVIQKATELGVKEIIPVITERSQPRQTRKIERWRKIAEEASRQCGRTVIPDIHEPVYFKDWFSILSVHRLPNGLIFYEEGGMKLSEAISLLNSSNLPFIKGVGGIIEKEYERGFFIVIGPEGGFTKEEVSLAEKRGFITTSLGKRILRAETAAISAIALVLFLLGDLG